MLLLGYFSARSHMIKCTKSGHGLKPVMNERQNIIKQHDSMTKKIKSVAKKFSLLEKGKTDLVERDKDIEKE